MFRASFKKNTREKKLLLKHSIVSAKAQSDEESPVMLSTRSLPLLPGPLCPGVVAPDRVLSMDRIELFDL